MLTGMVTDENRKLVRAETGLNDKYPGCKCHRNTGETSNATVHRVTKCPTYKDKRERLFGG